MANWAAWSVGLLPGVMYDSITALVDGVALRIHRDRVKACRLSSTACPMVTNWLGTLFWKTISK